MIYKLACFKSKILIIKDLLFISTLKEITFLDYLQLPLFKQAGFYIIKECAHRYLAHGSVYLPFAALFFSLVIFVFSRQEGGLSHAREGAYYILQVKVCVVITRRAVTTSCRLRL